MYRWLQVCNTNVQVIAEDVDSAQTSSTNVTIRMVDVNEHPPDFGTDVLYANVLETARRNDEVIAIKVGSHAAYYLLYHYQSYQRFINAKMKKKERKVH